MLQWTRALTESANDAGPLPFTLSTPGEKRDGLTLDQSLFRFENFRRNPVMLWQHGRDPMRGNIPIGRWDNIRLNDHGVMQADAVFDPEDTFAQKIESKYRRGFLNAASIGWMPVFNQRGQVESFDLLEASAVAVPADPDALANARAADLDFLRETWSRTEPHEADSRDERIMHALAAIREYRTTQEVISAIRNITR